MFTDSQVLNLLLWGFLIVPFGIGYIGGKLR